MSAKIELHSTEGYYKTTDNDISHGESTVATTYGHRIGRRVKIFNSGLSYGTTVTKELLERGLLGSGMRILEIGGGEGQMGRELLGYLRYRKILPDSYNMMDLNPNLLDKQRQATQNFRRRHPVNYYLGNGLELPFSPGSIDFVLANEVIADFPVIKNVSARDIRKYPELSAGYYTDEQKALLEQVVNFVRNYDLEIPLRRRFNFNLGALQFLSNLESILVPGGSALITEHSSEVERTDYWRNIPGFLIPEYGIGYPEEVKVKGHSEYSIKFSHLERVATKLGLKVELGHLYKFVGLKDFNLIENYDFLEELEGPEGVAEDFREMIDPLSILQFQYMILRKTYDM